MNPKLADDVIEVAREMSWNILTVDLSGTRDSEVFHFDSDDRTGMYIILVAGNKRLQIFEYLDEGTFLKEARKHLLKY